MKLKSNFRKILYYSKWWYKSYFYNLLKSTPFNNFQNHIQWIKEENCAKNTFETILQIGVCLFQPYCLYLQFFLFSVFLSVFTCKWCAVTLFWDKVKLLDLSATLLFNHQFISPSFIFHKTLDVCILYVFQKETKEN
jgi:hypothetical protein